MESVRVVILNGTTASDWGGEIVEGGQGSFYCLECLGWLVQGDLLAVVQILGSLAGLGCLACQRLGSHPRTTAGLIVDSYAGLC